MITIKSVAQIEKMRASGALLKQVLDELRVHIKPGVTTLELDRLAERMIRDAGAEPSFKGYNGFPYTLCASVDDQVVHGFATDEPLRKGQLLSLDCGAKLNGYHSDSAFSVLVGGGSAQAQKLIDVTEQCFWEGVKYARAGMKLGDIGHAIQTLAEKYGYGVIREMCGHGLGQELHEDPCVPNYGKPGRGVKLEPGMTIAIEPMISMGSRRIYIEDNDWTAVTQDHSLCSHYEHTVLITEGDPELLTWPGKKAVEP